MRGYTRSVRPAIRLSAVVAVAVLVWPLMSGASPRAGSAKPPLDRDVTGHITLRLRQPRGQWVTRLSLKLRKQQLTSFTVCGVWNFPAGRPFTCLGAGSNLAERTSTRIEQSPVANALRRDDSPGWGVVGESDHPVSKAILSNTVTGNRYGSFYYRVTLRDLSGKVLLASNKVKVVWHR